MWILATWGAIMPSLRKACPSGDPRTVQVRVRRMKDAVYFREHYLPGTVDFDAAIVTQAGTDYDARLYIQPDSLATALATMAMDIDYTSFKDQTTIKHKDNQLHDAYYKVWHVLYDRLSTRKAFTRSRAQSARVSDRNVVETVYRTETKEWRMNGASPETLANLMKEIDAATGDVVLPSEDELAEVAQDIQQLTLWQQQKEMLRPVHYSGPTEVNGHLDHSHCAHNMTASARRKCRKRFYGRN